MTSAGEVAWVKMRLTDKVALITGGAGAIGLAAAKLLVREGARVVLVDLSEPALEQALQAIGTDAVSYIAADVTTPHGTQRYVRAALERHGGIDVFLANASCPPSRWPATARPRRSRSFCPFWPATKAASAPAAFTQWMEGCRHDSSAIEFQ